MDLKTKIRTITKNAKSLARNTQEIQRLEKLYFLKLRKQEAAERPIDLARVAHDSP